MKKRAAMIKQDIENNQVDETKAIGTFFYRLSDKVSFNWLCLQL